MKEYAKGKVYLVGAGPGDPGLITVKGMGCISDADVIVYDRLVNETLLDSARPDAEKIYAGKSPDGHTLKQAEINKLLVQKASEGNIVVRLKGGDPFVFGRGGEEAEALASKGIPFEIVPGVTAAVAVPAYAGIPVTHRGYASSLAIITGHEDTAKELSSINWEKLATGADTLVFLMGVQNLAQIAEKLISCGRPPQTPVALIREGTGPRQQTITGTLNDIAALAAESKFAPPAVFVVGDVVRLREGLRWFDNRPLFNKRILVTRAKSQAGKLSMLLAQNGAEPVEVPTIDIKPMPDYSELDKALCNLADYEWIIFTSTNSVDVVFSRLHNQGLDSRAFKDVSICAIGPATAKRLAEHGIAVDYMPAEFTSDRIIEGLVNKDIRGKRVLLPRAAKAPRDLVEGLHNLGALVDEIPVYQTEQPSSTGSSIKQVILDGDIDIVTFTSASTAHNLASLLGSDLLKLNNAVTACIGPVTAAAAAESGFKVDIVAEEHTIPGLVRSIIKYYEEC